MVESNPKGSLVRENLINLCRVLRSDLKDLQILKQGLYSTLTVLDAQSSSPFAFVGDGMKRLLRIACSFASSSGGVVLIEEPEAFLHPKGMNEFTRLMVAAVSQGTQVIFTTHSLELLGKIFERQNGHDLGQACLVRTKLSNGELTTGVISGLDAAERLSEVGEDLRR